MGIKLWMLAFSGICLEAEIQLSKHIGEDSFICKQDRRRENAFEYAFRIKFCDFACNYLKTNCFLKPWVLKADSIMLSLLKEMQARGSRWNHQSALDMYLLAHRWGMSHTASSGWNSQSPCLSNIQARPAPEVPVFLFFWRVCSR